MQRKVLAFLPYVGGKNFLFAWLKNYIPDGGLPYCEPFVGGGGVFFYRQRAEKEVINDIDSALISVYRAYQLANDGTADAKAFRHMVNYTLYARNELRDAVEIIRMFRNGKTVSEINLAWAKLVAHRLGTGGREARQVGDWGRTLYALRPSDSTPLKLLSYKKIFRFFLKETCWCCD